MQILDELPGFSSFSGISGDGNKKNVKDFHVSASTDKKSTPPTDSQIISYYKNLCKDYPNVTFKIADIEAAKRGNAQYYIGYKGNSYQQGNNFSCPGQCSIQIDVGVIRKMMTDPEYESSVRGNLQNLIAEYSQFEQWGRQDGYGYCYVDLRNDETGKVTHSIGFSHSKASTDEEIRKMWNGDSETGDNTGKELRISYEQWINKKIIDNSKNHMQEAIFSMFEASQHHRNNLFNK